MRLIIAESFKRFFEINSSKSRVAQLLLEDCYTTIEFGNYIARRNDMISFLPAGKEHLVNDNGDWKRENRQVCKAGKLARKLIDEKYYTDLGLKDTDFELFANLIKADKINDEDCAVKFIEVKGEDIRFRYHEDNHSQKYSLGSMGESCMRYDKAQSYLDLYVENPKQVSMLVLVDCEDKTVGRAIVWQTNVGTFMDRVYATNAHQKMFEGYAEDKGWMYKQYHSNNEDSRIMHEGEARSLYPVVKLSNYEFDEYPYMDTMCYLSDSGKLSNDTAYNDKELRCTGGNYESEDDHYGETYDDIDDRWIHEDDAVRLADGNWTHRDNTVNDDYTDEYILERDSVTLENGKTCHNDNAIYISGKYYHEDDSSIYYIDGEYYIQDDVTYDELQEKDILIEESVTLYDGRTTHKDCNSIVQLDESYCQYKDKVFAETDEAFECPYTNTWFLTTDSVMTYSGIEVSRQNVDKWLEDNPEEVVPAPNQLALELTN